MNHRSGDGRSFRLFFAESREFVFQSIIDRQFDMMGATRPLVNGGQNAERTRTFLARWNAQPASR